MSIDHIDQSAVIAVERQLCESDHLFFTRRFFKPRMDFKFSTNWHHVYIAWIVDEVIAGRIANAVINVPPGAGKTELMTNLIPRGIALNPRSRFLYLSFSQSLVDDVSATARNIVKSPDFQRMWRVNIASDTDAKSNWKTEVDGFNAGHVYAASMGGQVTGRRAGTLNEGFTGCFPAWEKVVTDKGDLSFAEIRSYSGELKALSMNVATSELEYQAIDKLWVNPANDIYGVILSDGNYFEATSDHKIMTTNGYVEVKDLASSDIVLSRFSDVLHLGDTDAKQVADLLSWSISVQDDNQLFLRVFFLVLPISIRKMIGSVLPCFSGFDLAYNAFTNSIDFGEILTAFSTGEYFNGLLTSEFCARSSFHQRESTMPDGILHVVGLAAISEIIKSIILMITVEMSDFFFWESISNECLHDKLMNISRASVRTFAQANPEIAISVLVHLEHFFGQLVRTALSVYSPIKAFNSAYVADGIKPLITRDRTPLFINKVGHVKETFCLTVRGNHNFTLSQSQVIVSNCIVLDDPLKPEDAFSKNVRDKANRQIINTVNSRKAKSDTPIIMIMQRLHVDDPTGFIMSGGLPGDWELFSVPALIDGDYIDALPAHISELVPRNAERDDQGRQSYWPLKESLRSLLQLEQGGSDKTGAAVSRYTFSSQYQQAPKKLSGGLIKTEWFGSYAILPPLKWRAIWVDTANKIKQHNDYTVFLCGGLGLDGNLYLIDLKRGKWEAPDLVKEAPVFMAKHKPQTHELGALRYMAVEDAAAGTGLIQTVRRLPDSVPIKAVQRGIDKLTRFMDVQMYIEQGRVYVPDRAPWLADFLAECEGFKADMTHDHDDQVDTLIDAINDTLAIGHQEPPLTGGQRTY